LGIEKKELLTMTGGIFLQEKYLGL
jgi:hypothetical protein